MNDFTVIHLHVTGCSGRAVQLRMLAGWELDAATAGAATECKGLEGAEAAVRLQHRKMDRLLCRAIKGVTEKGLRPLLDLERDVVKAIEGTELAKDEAAKAAGARRKAAAEAALADGRAKLDAFTATTEAALSGWTPGSPYAPPETSLFGMFTAKDLELLTIWYRRNHEPSAADLEAVLGNARTIAS